MIISLNGISPRIAKSAFIADNAVIIGDVEIGENSAVWFGAVLRGDEEKIVVGENSNIQDNTTVHSDARIPVIIGNNVTIGHNCIIHGCTIDDNTLIGMGTIVMNGSHIGSSSIVGAASLVTQNKEFKPNSMIIGHPAKATGLLDEDTAAGNQRDALEYVELAQKYKDTAKIK